MQPVIGIVGVGKVGSTVARLWYEAGYTIGCVSSRNGQTAKALAAQVDSKAVDIGFEVCEYSELIVLCVPDDVIRSAAHQLVDGNLDGKGVIHVSGAQDVEILSELSLKGAMVGSLHPIFPFSDVDRSMRGLPGSVFALQADYPRLHSWLTGLVESVSGKILIIPKGQKSIYHAALVFASNYSVVLYSIADQLLHELSDDTDTIHRALHGLFEATSQNLDANRPYRALTGPLVRGDITTLELHLGALSQMPDLLELYKLLALSGIFLLRERGLPEDRIALISQIMEYGY